MKLLLEVQEGTADTSEAEPAGLRYDDGGWGYRVANADLGLFPMKFARRQDAERGKAALIAAKYDTVEKLTNATLEEVAGTMSQALAW